MNKEGSTPDFSRHLIDELDAIGADVFTDLGTEYEVPSSDTENTLSRESLIELLNRMVASPSNERHLGVQDSNVARALLERMGYPISDYDSLLATHATAMVADKLIEAKKDSESN